MKFSEGRKNFEMFTNCSSESASPAHILECLELTKQDLADVPLLVLDFLKVYDVILTWSSTAVQWGRATTATKTGFGFNPDKSRLLNAKIKHDFKGDVVGPQLRVLMHVRGSRVVKVSDRGWPCHEFEPSTTKEPPCRGAMHVKSVKKANVLPLMWCGN
ncbi:hypothetical protein TNCV_1542761 [Trichonephila clavipes]|nr:hypothetical protein TNCV_1542761 [Trichonephila clavipes]